MATDLGRSLRDGLSPYGSSQQAVSPVPASIPSAVNLAESLTPNMAGELLREVSFAEAYGCYSCFDLRGGFEPVSPFLLSLKMRTALLGCFANTVECVEGISAFRHLESGLHVAWYWDGDGTLVFKRCEFMLSNSDCKKDDEWERHEAGDWLDGYEGYEDDAQAIEARRAETLQDGSVGDESAVLKGCAQPKSGPSHD